MRLHSDFPNLTKISRVPSVSHATIIFIFCIIVIVALENNCQETNGNSAHLQGLLI